ncbi:MAG: PQQ-binding-like beta-propeller repeat protein [Phycisphaerae bacterium]|nr:PQQ-binding-like beta-propeller repeat protein [Phycisphaerae bacterium]
MRVMHGILAGCVIAAGAPAASAQNWSNSGGNAGRNGRTIEVGPDAPTPLWSGGRSSSIAWQPVIEGDRLFVVRQTGFPPEPNSDKAPVVAMNLHTGAELWFRNIPFNTGEWTTWIAGVRDGRVYVSRSGNGASAQAYLHCLDAASGATLWISTVKIDAGPYDGVVFAPDGDPVIASFTKIWRFNATDGAVVWTATRVGSVSGNCGGAANVAADAFYVADAVAGGHAIKRFRLSTGAFQYQSPVLPGFTIQATPMVGPDGTVYLSRTQNSAPVDFFYAINDSGSAMSVRWSVPARWTTSSEFAVASDGSVYMLAPGNVIKRLDGATGATLATSPPINSETNMQPRLAVDRLGRVFVSNGTFANGRLYAFNADLSARWSVPLTNSNIGAPAIGSLGTLIVAGVGTDIRAYRTVRCPGDFNADGAVDDFDYFDFLNAFGLNAPEADFNRDGSVDDFDFFDFVNAFFAPC